MIIFINGSINAGKSTISEILAEKLPNTAHIEVDLLRRFIKQVPMEKAHPISKENALLVAENLVKHKFDVIIDYPMGKPELKQFIEKLSYLDSEFYFFSLSPKLENILTTRGGNLGELSEDQKDRIRYHYSIGLNNPGFGIVIDSTDQTPEETAEVILGYIKNRNILDTVNL